MSKIHVNLKKKKKKVSIAIRPSLIFFLLYETVAPKRANYLSFSQAKIMVRSSLKESPQASIVILTRKLHLIRWPENPILLPVYVTLYSFWQHDSGTECTPGESKNLGQKENGNYIMYARATSGDKLNNNKFSLCSIRNISQVLEKKRNNCFVGMYIFPAF